MEALAVPVVGARILVIPTLKIPIYSRRLAVVEVPVVPEAKQTTRSKYTHKLHFSGEEMADAPYDTNSYTKLKEPALTPGFLGSGKLIPTNTTGRSDAFDKGDHTSDGEHADSRIEDESSETRGKKTGPTP